ncbi:glycosyltransferase [uncultured Flavobacterium sp.]|uniref:glycosyltransferase n=1 Tax=uncultured Flavobacterium sp. TaxID=165435 RepID=UPI0030EDFD0E|tara:strand:- start:1011 stop:2117 length:1107 start_codon:yes stop_codon:yes gene_type:complete
MKIIHIINSLATGGAEKLILDTLPLYNEKGIHVDLLLLWDNNCMFTQELKKMDCGTIHILKTSKNYKDIYSISNIFKIAKILKNYDLAHVHLFPAQYYVVLANILIGNKCKLVFTEHNTTNRRIKSKLLKPLESFIYKRYIKLICITEEIKNIYLNYLNKSNSQLVVIQNGVNINSITEAIPHDRIGINEHIALDDVIIIQVAAFRPQKDQLTLIKAMQFLPNHFKLLLVGEGENKKICEAFVTKEKLTNRVFFLGQRADIPRLLKSVDLVVLSSKYEGLSLSSIEGLASGVPFIASDVPGLREIVKGYGVLFEEGNTTDLINKINNLINDNEYYLQIAKTCLERSKHFDISIMIEKHIKLYKEIHEA